LRVFNFLPEKDMEMPQDRRAGAALQARLDDAGMDTQQAWAASLRRTRHIGDFRNWKDHDAYKVAFDRLLRDLKAEKIAASEL
jgi:hypothetical protein